MASGNRNGRADVAAKNAKFLSFLSTIPIDIFFLSSVVALVAKYYIVQSFLDQQKKILNEKIYLFIYNYYKNMNYILM